MQTKRDGPFQVIAKINDKTYKLHIHGSLITRTKTKRMQEALNGLIDFIWVKSNAQQKE